MLGSRLACLKDWKKLLKREVYAEWIQNQRESVCLCVWWGERSPIVKKRRFEAQSAISEELLGLQATGKFALLQMSIISGAGLVWVTVEKQPANEQNLDLKPNGDERQHRGPEQVLRNLLSVSDTFTVDGRKGSELDENEFQGMLRASDGIWCRSWALENVVDEFLRCNSEFA